ncbi:MAG: hypothetical protein Q7R79_05050 [bacterium]|nr:hypothetical protein [bacterium]
MGHRQDTHSKSRRQRDPYRGRSGTPTKVSGHKTIGLKEDVFEYASYLEARFAKLLIEAGVRFKPHQRYPVYGEEGEQFTYAVDFVLEQPQKFGFWDGFYLAVEVKGVLSYKDLRRKKALEHTHDLPTFILTEPLIDLYEREGLKKPSRSNLGAQND